MEMEIYNHIYKITQDNIKFSYILKQANLYNEYKKEIPVKK